MSVISEAIIRGETKEVERLIAQGADVNEVDAYGYTPLQESAIMDNLEAAALLLAHGAEVDKEDILGLSALQWAVDKNNLPLSKLLLEHGADPNHYTVDGQPILVNPLLRSQEELIHLLVQYGAKPSFAWDFVYAKLLGHRFELTGAGDIVNASGQFVKIDFEGFFLEFTVGIIQRSLVKYLNWLKSKQLLSNYQVYLQKIGSIFGTSAQLVQYKYNRKTKTENEILSLLSSDFLLLPVAYEGHAITFVKAGRFLAKCDRGVNHLTDTIIIYAVRNLSALNANFLYDLLIRPKTNAYIQTELKTILDLKPVMTLPSRYQLSGNCSWANVEAAMPALLFLLLFDGELTKRFAMAQLKDRVMNVYDGWAAWDKARILDAFIEDFYHSDKVQRAAKAAILCFVLVQRCDWRNQEELRIAKKIIPLVTLPEYNYILKSCIEIYGKVRSGKIGENVLHLLKLCGVHLTNMTLNLPLHLAVKTGQLSSVKYLLENTSVDVNAQDASGSTALHYAAWLGHEALVRYLVEIGHADIHLLNLKGSDAMRYAQFGGHGQIVKYLMAKRKVI